MNNSNNSEISTLLTRGRQNIFGIDQGDFSATVARRNLERGLGRMFSALDKIEKGAEARFFCSPDFTVTRNNKRWQAGIAYGGLLEVLSKRSIVFPDIRPNTCGTLTGKINEEITPKELTRRISRYCSAISSSEWDYGRKNHFVNMYTSKNSESKVFIIHGCPRSVRHDNGDNHGLYLDLSPSWLPLLQTFPTPLGNVSCLLDAAAKTYWHTYKKAEEFSMRSREELAIALFGDFELIANETHEGMTSEFTYILGCHAPTTTSAIFPLLTTLSDKAYLVKAKSINPCPSPKGVLGLLPHGMGYVFPMEGDVEIQIENNGQTLYVLTPSKGASDLGQIAFRGFEHVPFDYRSSNLVQEWECQQIFDIIDTLRPEISVKY